MKMIAAIKSWIRRRWKTYAFAIVPPYYHDVVVNAFGGPTTVINLPFAHHNSPVDAASNRTLQAWIDHHWAEVFPATQPSH